MASQGAAGGRPWLAWRWVAVALAALLVFAGTMAVIEWRRADNLANQATLRNNASATAAVVGQALFTFDYRDLSATSNRILALATGGFAKQETANSKQIEANLIRLKAVGTATVQEVSVTGMAAGGAAALVVVDGSTHTVDGSAQRVSYLHMSLLLLAGRWKVAAVQTLVPAG